jgi:hypothetical protein
LVWFSPYWFTFYCLSTPGTIWLGNASIANRNIFLGDLSAALASANNAVVKGTNKKQLCSWRWYRNYLMSIRISDDIFLESFDRGQILKILCAFAQSTREGRFGTQPPRLLKAESVRATLDCVAQTYKLAIWPDPRLDADGKLAFHLQWQLWGYSASDPGEQLQVAIAGSVLQKFHQLALSAFDKALCELFIGALFFAMRLCEYVKVQGPRKMKLLQLKNIRFFQGNSLVPHSDPKLSTAECVSITFEFHKRDTKNDMITQHRSGDRLLCPVRVWAAIVTRIRSYAQSSPSNSVNTFQFPDNNKLHLFSGSELLKRLCFAASSIGSDSFGFSAK